MKTEARVLLTCEAILCFAPSVLGLMLGLLMLPVWFGTLYAVLFLPEYRNATPAFGIVITIVAILAVLCGILGIIGFFRVMSGLLSGANPAAIGGWTRTFALAGVVSLLYGCVAFWALSPWASVFLGIVPLVASGHILYLARGRLFPCPLKPAQSRITSSCSGP